MAPLKLYPGVPKPPPQSKHWPYNLPRPRQPGEPPRPKIRRYSRTEAQAIAWGYHFSRLTQSKYADLYGIPMPTLASWLRKYPPPTPAAIHQVIDEAIDKLVALKAAFDNVTGPPESILAPLRAKVEAARVQARADELKAAEEAARALLEASGVVEEVSEGVKVEAPSIFSVKRKG